MQTLVSSFVLAKSEGCEREHEVHMTLEIPFFDIHVSVKTLTASSHASLLWQKVVTPRTRPAAQMRDLWNS